MLRSVSQSGGHAFQYGIPDGVVSGRSGRMGAPLARQPSRLVRTFSAVLHPRLAILDRRVQHLLSFTVMFALYAASSRAIIIQHQLHTFRTLACPLGELAARYLASRGYGAEDIKRILQAHRCTHTSEDVVTFLAGQGMSVSKARFLLLLVGQRSYCT
ncbi:hypothetical protein EDC04DRAFT_2711989 [Pisolithus marmoratus]|nr:hypothetical protein EDC04DRAFT_2711989 [Pisolithus marmoratus]